MKRIFLAATVLCVTSACGGGGDGNGDGGTTSPPAAVTSVDVTLGAPQLLPGGSTTATAALRSATGTVLSGRSIVWSSSASSVATVDGSGAVTAIAQGTTAIVATSEGRTGSALLTVSPPPVASIGVTLSAPQLFPGGAASAAAELRSASGTVLSGRAVAWSSSATTVAIVDGTGAITAIAEGTATIVATSEGKTGSAVLIVAPPPVATVNVALASQQIFPGGSTAAVAELRSAAGAVLSGRSIAWSSSATSIATVDAGGNVTAIAQGTTSISATSEGKSGSAVLTVAPPPVSTVSVTLAQTSVRSGTPTVASAVLRDDRGNVLTGRTIAWSSSATSVATVDGGGTVLTVSPGTVVITAISEGRTGAATLTVMPPPVTSVVVTGSTRAKVGDAYNYTATARIADGSIVVRPVSWSIRETARGVMTPQGVLTPLLRGLITLQATIDGVVWEATTTGYDWEVLSSSGTQFVVLEADNLITNKFGTSEYPQLVVSCGSSGYFFVWVRFDHFVTASGSVAMSYDGGSPFSQTWNELSPTYSTLWKPGNNGTVKAFALQLASIRVFGFAFTEFQGSAKAMLFRVTGLAPLLPPLMTLCPSNAVIASAAEVMQSISSLHSPLVTSNELRADRMRRAITAPDQRVTPSMQALNSVRVPESQPARRRP